MLKPCAESDPCQQCEKSQTCLLKPALSVNVLLRGEKSGVRIGTMLSIVLKNVAETVTPQNLLKERVQNDIHSHSYN